MKGLTLNSLEKKEQAYECAKMGLRYNISSPICWHVYGLIYRSDRNYAEAKKCYLNAMRRDTNNLTLLRDLASLQIQLRDLTGFLKTRKQMLSLKPSRYECWYAFSMAWQLLGRFDEAVDVMIAFEDIVDATQKKKEALGEETKPNFEDGERKLYIIRLFEQAGRYQEALDYLRAQLDQIVDKNGAQEIEASLLLKLQDYDAAETQYLALIDINPENENYHQGFQSALLKGGELAGELLDIVVTRYEQLSTKYPRSSACKKHPLSFLSGDAFVSQLDAYLQPAIRKGIPSLWATIRNLYSTPEKGKVIEERALAYYDSLKKVCQFPQHENDEQIEPPSALLWTIIFLAQHFDQAGDYQRALDLIDEAIEHTPTAIDVYLYRAKILKHAGDIQKAADQMDECRAMDLADRYLNTVTTRYLLKADRVDQADSTVELFTRDADNHNVSLTEMQCVWYEQNAADSFLRTKQYGIALKKALSIDNHFVDFTEDQFDFHSYCLRKLTLRAYEDLLHFEDRLYSHENYYNCARTIIHAYLALFDNPIEKEKTPEELYAHLPPAEFRKAMRKWKRDQARKEEQERAKKEAEAKERQKQASKKKNAGPVDEDPEGKKLTDIEKPLDEASKYAASLTKWCGDRLETHLLAFDVYSRKSKWLLALRALKRSVAIDPNHPDVHYNKIILANVNSSSIENEVVRGVFEEGLKAVTSGASAKQLNDEYAQKAKTLPERFAICKAELLLDENAKDSIKSKLLNDLSGNPTRFDCVKVLEYLEKTFDESVADQYRDACSKLFPLCADFRR